MPRVFQVLFICLLLSILFAVSISEAAKINLKVGLIRNTWERGPGEFLPDNLKKLKVETIDLTEKFRAGEFAFNDINVLIIESYAMNDPAIAKFFAGEEMKQHIEQFTSQGGIIIEFPQKVEKEEVIAWFPADRYARRVEVNKPVILINEEARNYRFFREVSTKLFDKNLFFAPNYDLAPVNGFSQWRFFFTPAYADLNRDTAAILEADVAAGRIILLSIPFDNLPGDNLPRVKVAGMRLLIRNLMGYCDDVINKTVNPYPHTPSVISKVVKVTGVVFDDANRNGIRDKSERGIANALVSNSFTVEKTNNSGAYSITMTQHRNPFVTVCAPAGYWALNSRFYFKPNYDFGAGEEQKIDLPLVQAPGTRTPNVFFIHCNDAYISDEASAYNFLEDVKELNGFEKQYGFVVLTGNLIQWRPDQQNPTPRKENELAAKLLKNLRLYLITTPGHGDWGPENNRYKEYEEFRGPRFFSFQYGNTHFFVLDSLSMSPEIDGWFKKEAEIVRKDFKKNIVVFQYSPLNERTLQYFAENGVSAVFCGQMLSNREQMLKVPDSTLPPVFECGTSSLSFPGIDRTPRGFRLISISDTGIQTVYRLGGVKQNLAIVSPQQGAKANHQLPIVINAYDTGSFVNRIECTLTDAKRVAFVGPLSLRKYSDWMWSLEKPLYFDKVVPQNCRIIVKAYDNYGRTWSKESEFNFSTEHKSVELGEDWAQFKKDEKHSGATTGTLKPPLNLAWATHTGGITHFSSPVISDGTVFVGTQYLYSVDNNAVVALSPFDGRIKWRFKTDSPVKHTVAVKDGIVVAQASQGTIYGINAKNGKEIWRYDIKRTREFPITNPVVISKNSVYTGDDARFTALNLKDGDYLWDVNVEHHPNISVADAPAAWEDVLLVPFRFGMIKLAQDSGKKEMLREWNPQPDLGTEVERIPLHRTPAIAEDIMYASYYPGEPRLCAYDLDNHQFLWISPLAVGLHNGEEISSPAVADGIVVVGTARGEVAGVEAETGKVLWKSQTQKNIASFIPRLRVESSITSSPAICNGVAYIGSNDGTLYGFDVKTGDVVWKFNIGCPVTGSPAISGNTLFVTAYDGTVYAFTGQ